VLSAAFSPDGTKVVTGSDDKTVRIWSTVTGECEQTLEGHTGSVLSAAFSPDGTKVVTASTDKTVRIWSAVTGACERPIMGDDGLVQWFTSAAGLTAKKLVGALAICEANEIEELDDLRVMQDTGRLDAAGFSGATLARIEKALAAGATVEPGAEPGPEQT